MSEKRETPEEKFARETEIIRASQLAECAAYGLPLSWATPSRLHPDSPCRDDGGKLP